MRSAFERTSSSCSSSVCSFLQVGRCEFFDLVAEPLFVLASGFGLFAQPCEFTAQVAEPFVEGRILHPQVVVFGDRIDGLRAESL